MSSRRSQLFNSLRLFFWADVVLFLVLVSWFVYLRYQRSKLLEVVERQLAFNLRLSSDLAYANDVLTNRYFSAASSFVSNLVSSVVATNCLNSQMSLLSPSPLLSADSVKEPEFPDLSFHGYFEIDGLPYICIRNQKYRRGDIVLGFPIEDISPDVVQYRGKFYKVDEVKK